MIKKIEKFETLENDALLSINGGSALGATVGIIAARTAVFVAVRSVTVIAKAVAVGLYIKQKSRQIAVVNNIGGIRN
ncbi:hypothetical protein EW093_02265 [Thiospirochaeta perfilievii]|uniref:Uncharacterized protein n=1 Tax=Thiospirochaeta perfilievii TaxID=252967 RepID=A0A5C1Q9J1_9SPIO|nr:hypothetical protein [Thiospirochaeta perfilievii]QEN03569.1 hypothetical protein EW093_02265 [Thiospirochaeta perfilievii]